MKVGIVDNYDSFTYNLVHYLEEIAGERPFVCMNDQIDWNTLDVCTHLVLSPGPGLPNGSGELMKTIDKYHLHKNILGVCLGMQAVGEFFGAELKNLAEVQHGVQAKIFIEKAAKDPLYKNFPDTIEVGRYHSWVVDEKKIPDSLCITSKDQEGNIMSLKHVSLAIHGVQYHPESIMTSYGKRILENWLRYT